MKQNNTLKLYLVFTALTIISSIVAAAHLDYTDTYHTEFNWSVLIPVVVFGIMSLVHMPSKDNE